MTFAISQSTLEDQLFSYQVGIGYTVTLANGQPLPSWLGFDANTGILSGTPSNGEVGVYELLISKPDGAIIFPNTPLTLAVVNVNDAPEAILPLSEQAALEFETISFTLPANAFTDIDLGDQLTYTATLASGEALPDWLSFDPATLTFSGTVSGDDAGDLELRVIATDTSGASAGSNFVIKITSRLIGTEGDDHLVGTAVFDIIEGLGGNDTLDGGVGADKLVGGQGDDTYVIDTASDEIIEISDAGNDTVQSGIAYVLASNLENLTLLGSSAINGTGNAFDNVLTGSSGNNTLNGLGGNDTLDGTAGVDTLIGGFGNDTYIIDSSTDTLTENAGEGTDTVQSSVTYTLVTNFERLTLLGTANINGTGNTVSNILTGNSGNNTLTGGGGTDTLIGGLGNDIYVVDTTTDIITESADGGTDTVQSSVTYTLGSYLERLTLTGTSAINGTGNSLNNTITGNSANNVLKGGAGNDSLSGGGGADTMQGGTGDDSYTVNSSTDVVTEAVDAGIDTVKASLTYILGANLENLTLTGSALINGTGNDGDNILIGNSANNTLSGGAGYDTLDGGAGADILIGGTGGDLYRVDNASDVVQETITDPDEFDDVESSISYTLGANLENLTLIGTANINATGNSVANVLYGNAGNNVINAAAGNDLIYAEDGNDTINGGDGDDYLNGGAGNDTISGGAGIDRLSYWGASAGVTVNLSITAAQNTGAGGIDTLSGIESLSGTEFDDTLTGNSQDNDFYAYGGNDHIYGMGGNDTFFYSQRFFVTTDDDTGNDVLDGGSGSDTVDFSYIEESVGGVILDLLINTSQVAISGMGADIFLSIENVRGTNSDDQLLGNAAANYFNPVGGTNFMDGREGNDILDGLYSANNTYRFSTALNGGSNVDTILGFWPSSHTIQLDNAIFTKLGSTGAMNASFFKANTTGNAADANDYILYETDTGKLFYDADGSGGGAKVQFAIMTINGDSPPTSSDFFVV